MTLATAGMLGACTTQDTTMQTRWTHWQAQWRWMEAIARKRHWQVTPLLIAPPATERQLLALEERHRLSVPTQLRRVLRELSANVTFGWHIPSHLHAMEQQDMPSMSVNRDAVWSLTHIDTMALPIFLEWKRDLASRDLSEAPNRPEMWENQFAFYNLINGDWLTIDTGHPDPTRQPVRYFSHELEMLHGLALAPDFFTFIDQMSALGLAGTEWASWMRFGNRREEDRFYLDARSDGAKTWLAWLQRDPAQHDPDTPPLPIVERSVADRALLDAARANALDDVAAALLAGAVPDCTPDSDWLMEHTASDQEFSTAINYATRHDNIAMIERLLKAGATLNTRLLPLNTAVKYSTLATVRWLIDHGARVNGWQHQRYWPLHDLVVTRGPIAAMTREQYRQQLIDNFSIGSMDTLDAMIASAKDAEMRERYLAAKHALQQASEEALKEVDGRLRNHISLQEYLDMLEALLDAGADPDAPWDNGNTMLSWCGAATARVLLAHGADPNARNIHGSTALHTATTGEKVRLLVAGGADINAWSIAQDPDDSLHYTPLQSALLGCTLEGDSPITALLELGADATLNSADGRSSLAYCFQPDLVRLIMSKGLDPLALQPSRQTLLHNLTSRHWLPRHTFPQEVAFLDFLLSLGIDINARDARGRTLLHYAAEQESNDESAPNYVLVLARGADKTIKDNDGKRAVDLFANSLQTVRAALR
ncbi:ankyrin repeat domain-containing protein [Xanthomonas axonopodis pv. poinsettiicola]|uniref:ankyrin repeat domain-containing protein n=1 Tax=Xanthomonas TaxID=338 RepID=UPI001E445F55|nr:ankyrin repeat domain-containing protein [Xanthomonas codiaei]MCC8538401.1 ankyrin repeat domain-containing protein [Xanthomonas codiaei]